jgi:hypothetical protein
MDEAWLSNAGGGASVVRARIICEGEKWNYNFLEFLYLLQTLNIDLVAVQEN